VRVGGKGGERRSAHHEAKETAREGAYVRGVRAAAPTTQGNQKHRREGSKRKTLTQNRDEKRSSKQGKQSQQVGRENRTRFITVKFISRGKKYLVVGSEGERNEQRRRGKIRRQKRAEP